MKRVLVLCLGLLVMPSVVAAQIEIGVDAGVNIQSFSAPEGFGDIDNVTTIGVPTALRIGIPAGDMIRVETLLAVARVSSGGESFTTLSLIPGVNYMVGDRFYVRGEAGITWISASGSDSTNQIGVGGGAGLRIPMGMAVFRAEGVFHRRLEKENEFFAGNDIRFTAGVSVAVN